MEHRRWTTAGIIFALIMGTLLHFVYDWSGGSQAVGIFGAVSESTWEHLKLIFWPVVIFSAAEYFFGGGRKYLNFIPAVAFGVLFGMLVTVALFNTYTGILGFNLFPLDIAAFIAGVIAAYRLREKLLSSGCCSGSLWMLAGLLYL